MKSRSHVNEAPDDWGDGSWTVDCVCGVNFDDGEEMVDCDECSVWVHTRCSRYIKGATSFTCDKCKSRKNRTDSEETEVAQLLVELPTKTMRMENPLPHCAPPRSSPRLWTEIPIEERVHVQGVPGGDPALFQGLSSVFTSELWKCSSYVPKKFSFQYREFPCWDEKQERVAKFDEENENPVDIGADALFSLSKDIVSASPVEMLVSLRGSLQGASREKKSFTKEGNKRDRNDSAVRYVHSGGTRETNHLRPPGLHLGKRKKDNIRSKDLTGKKRARSSREVDGKKRVSTTASGAQQTESLKVADPKVAKTDFEDAMNRDKTTLVDPDPDGCFNANNNRTKDNLAVNVHYAGDSFKKAKSKDSLAADFPHADDLLKKPKSKDNLAVNGEDLPKNVKPKGSLEASTYIADDSYKRGRSKDKSSAKFHHEDYSKKVKPKENLSTNAYHVEDTSKESWKNSSLIEIVVKSGSDHQVPTRTGSSSEAVSVEVSLLEPNGICSIKKHEDLKTSIDGLEHLKDEKHDPQDLSENLSKTALSSPKWKPLVGDLRNAAAEAQNSHILQNSKESMSPSSLRPGINVKTEANDNQPKGISSVLSSPFIDVKLDTTTHLDQHMKISVSEHPNENVQVHERDTSNFLSVEVGVTESKALSFCYKDDIIEGMIPITGEPCQNKETMGSAGTLSVQESSTEPKHLKIVEEPSKAGGVRPPSPSTQRKVILGFGKSSSTVVTSKSEVSGSCKPPGRPPSPSALRPIHFTKRVKANSFTDVKKDHTVIDAVKDDLRHEEPKKTTREQLKPPAASTSKLSHMSRASHASLSKRTLSDSKEPVLYTSSKTPVTQNVTISTSSIDSTSTLQSQSGSLVQNKATASGFSEKGERSSQSGPHQSSKVTHASSMHPPPPVNSSSTLTDEELALLLHQELNSSPRVPRVPRMRHAGSIPQSAPPTATSMLIKCTSSSGVKDHIPVPRRKGKEEAPKDGSRNARELIDEAKKIDRAVSSHDYRRHDQIIASDSCTKKEALGGSPDVGVGHTAKNSAPLVSTTTLGQSSSTEATDPNLSSLHKSPKETSEDDDDGDAGGIAGPTTRTLPGLLDEIMRKGKRMTYEELCNAVLPHWNNLRKHNGERYAYSSHSQAVLDCLRNRNEWAQLVDRGPKTNAGRKKRKIESELPPGEPEENDYATTRATKELAGNSFEAHPEDFPKGKRKARKRRRLALQGRGIRDVRKRQKANSVTDDDMGGFSHSSDNGDNLSDDSQGNRCTIGSEASSSFDEAGSM